MLSVNLKYYRDHFGIMHSRRETSDKEIEKVNIYLKQDTQIPRGHLISDVFCLWKDKKARHKNHMLQIEDSQFDDLAVLGLALLYDVIFVQ